MTDESLDAALAERLARAARAAQDLCDVLWEALNEELSGRSETGPCAQLVVELSGRVVDVASTVAALAAGAARDLPARESPVAPAEFPTVPEPLIPPEPPEPPETFVASSASDPSSGIVIIDERQDVPVPAPPRAAGRSPIAPPEAPRTSQAQQTWETRRTWEAQQTSEGQQTSEARQARALPWDTPLAPIDEPA